MIKKPFESNSDNIRASINYIFTIIITLTVSAQSLLSSSDAYITYAPIAIVSILTICLIINTILFFKSFCTNNNAQNVNPDPGEYANHIL